MKSVPRKKTERSLSSQTRRSHPARKVSTLPQEVQDFMQKFQEWTNSFHHPTRRRAYIKRICDRIVETYHPEQIILFGSHAYGQPTPDSDLDLLVVMHFEGSPIQQAIKVRRELEFVAPMDLLIRTPEQVQERLRINDPFMHDIWHRGKVMYETRNG